jgi:holin-like protein
MIVSFTIILFCQLLGEITARALGVPIPGPVMGMLFLLLALGLRDRLRGSPPSEADSLTAAGRGLLANMSLMFIPAGVGVVQNLDVLATYSLGLSVALIVSTVLTLLVTVVTFVSIARLTRSGPEVAES